jgi:hypothetical protein
VLIAGEVWPSPVRISYVSAGCPWGGNFDMAIWL